MTFTANQRNSFRVDDRVTLNFTERSSSEIADIRDDFAQYRMRVGLRAHFRNRREHRQPILKTILSRYSEIGLYLEALEDQIDQLARNLESSNTIHDNPELDPIAVNISADGVRFCWTETLEIGQEIELIVRLPPDQLAILALAEVVRVEADGEDYWISFKFNTIHEEDRELLIKYAVRVQQKQLRARRVQ